MSLLLKNYSLVEVTYLLIGFNKTKFFQLNKKNTDRNGVNKQITRSHTSHSVKDYIPFLQEKSEPLFLGKLRKLNPKLSFAEWLEKFTDFLKQFLIVFNLNSSHPWRGYSTILLMHLKHYARHGFDDKKILNILIELAKQLIYQINVSKNVIRTKNKNKEIQQKNYICKSCIIFNRIFLIFYKKNFVVSPKMVSNFRTPVVIQRPTINYFLFYFF